MKDAGEQATPDVDVDVGQQASGEEVVDQVEQEAESAPTPEKVSKTVPLEALHEERHKRKELQAEITRIRQEGEMRNQRLEQRFAQIQEAMQPKVVPPAYDVDPLSNLKHGHDVTQEQLQQIQQRQAQQDQHFQRQQYVAQVHTATTGAEASFAQENPDYYEAVSHLKGLRHAQLVAFGMSQQEAANYVQNEALQIAEAALMRGQDPAHAAFEMAKASGWKRQESSGQQKMDTMQKGLKAASSLSGGGAISGKPTLEALADMPDDDFDKFMKSGGWDKLSQ